MATIEKPASPERLTTQELLAALDTRSRERLGMSAAEFLSALKAGKLDPYAPAVARLAILARLMSGSAVNTTTTKRTAQHAICIILNQQETRA